MKKLSIFCLFCFIFLNITAQTLVPYLLKNGNYIYVDSAAMKPVFSKECSFGWFSNNEAQKIETYNKERFEHRYGLINRKGELIAPVKYSKIEDFKDGIAIVTLTSKEAIGTVTKYGCINMKGKEVVPARFDKVEECKDGMITVALKQPDGKMAWGVYNKEGKEIFTPRYTGGQSYSDGISPYQNGIAKVDDNGKLGVADKTGKFILPLIYESVLIDENGISAKLNGKWRKHDLNGKEIYPPIYEDFYPISEYLRMVKNNGKWGAVNTNGKEVIPFIYETLQPMKYGMAAAKMDGKWGYIDKSGKVVIPFQYQAAYQFMNTVTIIQLNDKYGVIDRNGNEVIPMIYEDINRASKYRLNLMIVKQNKKLGVINTTGKIVIPIEYDQIDMELPDSVSTGYFHVRKGDRNTNLWGMIDENGKEILPLQFSSKAKFTEGMAPMKKKESLIKEVFNYYSTTGVPMLPENHPYTGGKPFDKGFAVVFNNQGNAVIDKKGKEIMPLKYKSMNSQNLPAGFFSVTTDGTNKMFIIDKAGREYREQ